MELALATDYAGEAYTLENVWGALRESAEHGITHMHWAHGWQGDHFYTSREMSAIQEKLREYDLQLKGIHASAGWIYEKKEGMYKRPPLNHPSCDYASLEEEVRRRGAELIRNRLELANLTGAQEIVLHLQLPYVRFEQEEGFQDKFYSQVWKSLDAAADVAQVYGVRICFENLVGTPEEYQICEFDRLFLRYPADTVGFCFDTGHGQLTNPKDPLFLARRYQNRLYAMHLNDNRSFEGDFSDDLLLTEADRHLVMGDGVVDFNGFADIAAGAPYSLPVIGEFVCYGGREEFFAKSVRRMTEFSGKIMEYRQRREQLQEQKTTAATTTSCRRETAQVSLRHG